jgi:hypothetical protein
MMIVYDGPFVRGHFLLRPEAYSVNRYDQSPSCLRLRREEGTNRTRSVVLRSSKAGRVTVREKGMARRPRRFIPHRTRVLATSPTKRWKHFNFTSKNRPEQGLNLRGQSPTDVFYR